MRRFGAHIQGRPDRGRKCGKSKARQEDGKKKGGARTGFLGGANRKKETGNSGGKVFRGKCVRCPKVGHRATSCTTIVNIAEEMEQRAD